MPKNQRRRKRRESTVAGPSRERPFADLIREAFDESGLTQEQFAERLGVKQPRIVEIFASASITEALFDRCAAALGVEIETRLVGEVSP